MPHRRTVLIASALIPVFLGVSLGLSQRKKNEEPKTQVLPLPPELPKALSTETEGLDFHISPLLHTGGLSAQIRQSLNDLIRDTHGETIIRLRAFVAGAGDARRVEAETANLFTERKLSLPVLSVLQIGALGQETAQVVIEAVVATHKSVNPNGLAFYAGETGPSFEQALERLKASVAASGVAPGGVLTSTCFTSQIPDNDRARALVQSAFPNTAINIVQAIRDPASDESMCEAIAQLPQPPAEGLVVILKKSRATLVDSHDLIFTWLQLSFGSFLDDAHEAFARLRRSASALQPVNAPVEVNAFTLDSYAASALLKTTSFPPSAFTAQLVEGLPAIDASGGVEAVLAAKVPEPVTVSR
jgi:enamine deaminase RidA (YjgF/YER057c/UK114 family)